MTGRIVLLAVAGWLVAGCTEDTPVASLTTQGAGIETSASASPAPKTQADTARDMVECLQEAKIAARLSGPDEQEGLGADEAVVELETDQAYLMSINGQLSLGATDEAQKDAVADLELLAAPYLAGSQSGDGSANLNLTASQDGAPGTGSGAAPPGPAPESDAPSFLILGDQDLTEPFVACVNATGYTMPEFAPDPAEELRYKESRLEGTMAWLRCARLNGWPYLADPPAIVADSYATMPSALLPATISPADLRALLQACPSFDTAAHQEADAYRQENFDDTWSEEEAAAFDDEVRIKFPRSVDPLIGFDAPGFGGGGPDATSDSLPDDVRAALQELQRILLEAEAAYYSDGSGPLVPRG
jgi:hypothetical protein